MTMKITKTGRGSERNDESLLFEWLNHEVPESLKLSYETILNTNKFAGSLQTNQIMGIYLEPITFSGEFFGEYISKGSSGLEYITAKERSDQLARLQGRIIKFWFEGIKQLVIIQKYEIDIKNYNHVEYTITLQPHDIQLPISPIEVKQYLTKSFIQSETDINVPAKFDGEKVIGSYSNLNPTDKFKKPIKRELTQYEKDKQTIDRNIKENRRLIGVQSKLNLFDSNNYELYKKISEKRLSLLQEAEILRQKLTNQNINKIEEKTMRNIMTQVEIDYRKGEGQKYVKGYR